MNRVQAAIQDGRCVLAVGGRSLQSAEVLAELRRRNVATVALGSGPVNPVQSLTADHVAPALSREGGIIVLLEPDAAEDSKALAELGEIIKAGAKKPKVFVAAKAFNPFALPMGMRLLKLEQLKMRALDFVQALAVAEPGAVAPAPVQAAPSFQIGGALHAAPTTKKDTEKVNAPRPDFIGRAEELPELQALIEADGGPIVVVGPSGVGRRWLVEKAIAGKPRLPDYTFGRGSGFDAFVTRVALAAKAGGDDRLHAVLSKPEERGTPSELAALVAATLQGEGLRGKVWVLHNLPVLLDRRDGSFYHDGRLEMVLRAIFTSEPTLRMVFISDRAPSFYKEGQARSIRQIQLGGLKGRELHELFSCWKAPEFSRDHFGPINERTHGHPLANRFLALTVREGADIDELLEQPKFLRAESVTDTEALRRHIERRVKELDDKLKGSLLHAALLRDPGTPDDLLKLGLSRADRLTLLGAGMLEQTPSDADRRYYVHPLVAEHLHTREIQDFEVMEGYAEHVIERAREIKKGGDLLAAVALGQEGNRLLVEARKGRSRMGMPYPDNDPIVDNVRGLLRQKKGRLDIARMRLNEALKSDPRNTELLLLDAELKDVEKAGVEAVVEVYSRAAAVGPTPEVFHAEATFHLHRSARGKAAAALEAGVVLFPEDARLHRRLATLYLQQNRLLDAVDILKKARDLEPMMPDSYGALGEIYTALGMEHWELAAQSIEEALRLDPTSAMHLLRQGALLRRRAMVDFENRATLLASAEEQVRAALAQDKGSPRVLVELGAILLDREGGDIEQAQWLLQQALKKGETPEALVQRARVLIRQGQFPDAVNLLDKAIKKEPSSHAAFAAQAELAIAQGNPFLAFEQLKIARERSPRNGPDRVAYDRVLQQVGSLIESGQAAELFKAAEGGATPAVEVSPAADGPRRDAGTTTVRRRRRGRDGGAESAPVESAPTDSAPIEGAPAETAETAEMGASEASTSEEVEPVTAAEATGEGDGAVEPAVGDDPVGTHAAEAAE
jgi:tetratricopeptide (TPR) repeat protein